MSSDDDGSPLQSPALGTSLDDLVGPCGDALRAATPPPVDAGPTLGLTFSGGGFRATFAALGVVRYLADAGLLPNTRYVSSVSGGSIANGVLACNWPKLRDQSFAPGAVDREVIAPVLARVTGRSLKSAVLRGIWRTVGPSTRTDLLARVLDQWFFGGVPLADLDPGCRWIVNAANLTTGVRFAFERDVVGDYVVGLAPTTDTGITLARAVAASAAVPGAFAVMKLTDSVNFPCGERGVPALLDGGAYDNTGLEALDSDRYRNVFTITMNAGGVFVTGGYGRLPVVRDLARSNSLLYRQSTALRARWMVDRFRAAEHTPVGQPLPPPARRGILVNLGSDLGSSEPVQAWRARFAEHRSWDGKDLAFVPTVLDKLEPQLCRALVYRGWWLTGAAFARYHPEVAPLPSGVEAPPSA